MLAVTQINQENPSDRESVDELLRCTNIFLKVQMTDSLQVNVQFTQIPAKLTWMDMLLNQHLTATTQLYGEVALHTQLFRR